ncbi:hypothetical protein SAMN05421827_101515 [Pedobacter terrae]|uniref:Uncharacterized protein n=1 Tax=Pedobacter terrae TaxID=405671 RepID=A0A1G7NV23_9SPHI|nr:hypothetical protein SAMN05421827_101515 [Pedobacter terrae]
MTETQITRIVIEEIDILSNFTELDIKALYSPPETDPKLSKFFSASLKSILAPNLKRRMRFIKSTELTNDLFVSIKTINQLVKAIKNYDTSNI